MNIPIYLGFSILEIIMNFGMIILDQIIRAMQKYTTQIQTALLFILKLKLIMKTLQIMLKKDLIHQIMIKMIIDLYQLVKTEK